MRICIIGTGITQVPPEKGGAVTKVIFQIAKAISNKHDVYVIDFGERRRALEKEGFKIIRVPLTDGNSTFRKLEFGIKAWGVTSNLDPDIVHLHSIFTALPFALWKPSKMVYTSHNPNWGSTNPDLIFSVAMKLEAFVMKRSDKVTAVSQHMKDCIRKKARLSKAKIKKIYNPVNINAPILESKNKDNKPLVVFLGRHVKHKGFHIFAKAASLINERMSIQALSMGPLGEFGKYKEKADNQPRIGLVKLLGPVSEEKKKEVLKRADVLLSPTQKEGFSLVPLEAQAAGTPVVISDVPSCKESIKEGETGLLSDRNPRSFANATIRILNEDWKRSHAKNIFDWAENFSEEKIAQEWRELYKELARENM